MQTFSSKGIHDRYAIKSILPSVIHHNISLFWHHYKQFTIRCKLWYLKRRMFSKSVCNSRLQRLKDYWVRVTDGPNFYMQYKDEFIRRIYHFDAMRPDPLIIDGGSNTGMSILYFKHAYPAARIIGFEPDPAIFRILEENVNRNKLTNVKLINAGLSAAGEPVKFVPDGSSGGHIGNQDGSFMVRMECLSSYLGEPIDFLKLNIEGEEFPVLQEAAASGKLRHVRELVLEYHGWANEEQRLGDILNLLDRNGYRYLVHDFDAETCSASKPPFQLTSETTWFCLVYALRWDQLTNEKYQNDN